MRVLLVGPDYEANLSLLYLAASLRAAGHSAAIAPFNTESDAQAVIAQARGFDLVGLSMCFQVRAREFLALADSLKAERAERPVVAGGHFASCAAEELLANHPALDLIAVHEGERTLVELADLGDDLLDRAGEVPGVVLRREGRAWYGPARPALAELETLPRPERSGPARLVCGVPTAYLMGSRGCVNSCDYCCITTLHRRTPGPRFRQRAPEDVADEMADLFHVHGVRQYVFHDDNFLVPNYEHNRARVARLDAALRERAVSGIGLVTKCSPRDADRRILQTLKGMGLIRLFMGVESGSACGLSSIGRKQTVEQSERALSLCEELGISAQYTVITLHPEATVESMLADLDFVRRHPAHPLNYCRAELYAGTPLEQRMIAQGRAEGDYLGRTFRYSDPKVELIWDLGSDLFAGRCWGMDELLGKVIRLDHQVAVLRHFYEGRKVEELARSFLDWEVELNLETSGAFRELVVSCGEASGRDDPTLARALADLRRREERSRAIRIEQACRFRAALDRFAQASVSSGKRFALAAAAGRMLKGPRHAAAVAVAIGMLACRTPSHDHGVAEAAPPPYDYGRLPQPQDAGIDAQVEGPRIDEGATEAALPYEERTKDSALTRTDAGPAASPESGPQPQAKPRHDHGVAEAAPPPYDRFRNDVGVAEAAPPPYDWQRRRRPPPPPPPRPDAGTPPIHDHGVAEAAPPPFDPYRNDHGVAEAAPPPYEVPFAATTLTFDIDPPARILYEGREIPGTVRMDLRKGGPVVLGENGNPLQSTFTTAGMKGSALSLRIVSSRPGVIIRFGSVMRAAPTVITLDSRQGPRQTVVLEDPESGRRMLVRLTLR